MSALLQTIDLCCERDDRRLVDHLNLTVDAGAIYQVEGPNGSGKTTLLRVLCGLSGRYTGQVLWRGHAIDRQRAAYYSQLLYIGHGAGIKAALTPRENLDWHSAMKGAAGDRAGAIATALARVGLGGYEDAPCYTLSAGQQRRVALARLFLAPAALWVLDEPFTAIDRQGVGELERWIEQQAMAGGSVVLTTHHTLSIERPVQRIRLGSS